MRNQSTHTDEDRGADAYFTPHEAIASLLVLEKNYIPKCIWEPAAGDGAITKPLQKVGYEVLSSDIIDYGLHDCKIQDYLTTACTSNVQGIITNPPFKLAFEFAKKALQEVSYLALLLRTNFLESQTRMEFFKTTPPSTVYISSRRLPMMHRQGWTGPESTSNTCHAWFVWNKTISGCSVLDWFDWAEIVGQDVRAEKTAEELDL